MSTEDEIPLEVEFEPKPKASKKMGEYTAEKINEKLQAQGMHFKLGRKQRRMMARDERKRKRRGE